MFLENYNSENELFRNFDCNYLVVVSSITSIKDNAGQVWMDKKHLDVFAPLLYNMFKKSLEQGRMPDEFKMATVVPILKSGDKSEVSSFILPNFCYQCIS